MFFLFCFCTDILHFVCCCSLWLLLSFLLCCCYCFVAFLLTCVVVVVRGVFFSTNKRQKHASHYAMHSSATGQQKGCELSSAGGVMKWSFYIVHDTGLLVGSIPHNIM